MQPVSINIYNNIMIILGHECLLMIIFLMVNGSLVIFYFFFCSNDSWRTVSIRFMIFISNFFLLICVKRIKVSIAWVGIKKLMSCEMKSRNQMVWYGSEEGHRLNTIVFKILLWALSIHWNEKCTMKENASFGRVHSIELLVDSMK